VDAERLFASVTPVALLFAVACGGSSVRRVGDDDASGGSTNETANGGAGVASGGGAGMFPHPTPSACAVLQSALSDAKRCRTDDDCGQILENWTCPPGSLTGITPKPPVVNLGADARDLESLMLQASRIGDCPLLDYACNDCVVDGFGCFEGQCDWRVFDCGPPPK